MKVVIVKEIEEMPKDCDSCPFQDFYQCCGILDEYTRLNEWVEDAPYYSLKEKGDCPLKPFPQEKTKIITENGKEPSLVTVAYLKGWNDCLKEIQK